ncbi:uncharacterized protein TNCV_4696291 [Trichonephila clavipes]|nr:uncharacterized protein TNCV_4696291 [Trichonephila clavipes]
MHSKELQEYHYGSSQGLRGSVFVVDIVSFPEGRNENCQSLRHAGLNDRWRHHLSPSPQFRHRTGGEGNILQPPAPVVSAATTHKAFGHTNLTSTYFVCTRRVFGYIGKTTLAFQSGVQCSNHCCISLRLWVQSRLESIDFLDAKFVGMHII